ncbi:hypothetical protein BVRB_1g000380 [Beta vulgaris subsp. vulgaris]|uniref:uncharacterized protein LOC104887921 n=1 Tax=Beta vulgaris subsp. vulgaris TaxID=3555 RepID=UPI00053F50EB|nr:uncharacterized protein LOC104887921 [Beta vulgaris subsp. vulgaris]KMT20018.1 hypothetical protein BVRB_1g000380 [Beta vulgaris subsp. vulgaris]
MGRSEKEEWNFNGVIVTVYEESSTAGPRPQKIRATHSKSTARSCGYNRRAELLAYAHHLRNVGPQMVHQDHTPTNLELPKPKRRRRLLARLKALRFSFGKTFRRGKKEWVYESVESRGRESKLRSCPYRRRGKVGWSKFSKRLRRVLKQFSCGCKCNKGFDQNDEQLQDLHNTI